MKHLGTSLVYGSLISTFVASMYILVRLAELVTGNAQTDSVSILGEAITVWLVFTLVLTILLRDLQLWIDSRNKPREKLDDENKPDQPPL
ncbi:MAG: hypothetical protein IPM23_02275 [Candidatus Melainabacteria bacterium]|nr:hypothetical protein [Candidatus Melainabacteria bacterium]